MARASRPPPPAGRVARTWRTLACAVPPARAPSAETGKSRARAPEPPKRPREVGTARSRNPARLPARASGEKTPITAAPPHSPQETRAEQGRRGPGGEHSVDGRAGQGSPGSSAVPQKPSKMKTQRALAAITLTAPAAAAPYSGARPT